MQLRHTWYLLEDGVYMTGVAGQKGVCDSSDDALVVTADHAQGVYVVVKEKALVGPSSSRSAGGVC
jgi:hypothetical protein